ncbi:leucine-rich repeat domain-containing protein [Candidatus Neptunochlamydia vexilliferae]|nr:leucine-rich repeat domain-containing protein [Candidatus Neptunochlamydia vexilliferae]
MSAVTFSGKENVNPNAYHTTKKQKTNHGSSFKIPEKFRPQFYLFKAIKDAIARKTPWDFTPMGNDETLWKEFLNYDFRSWVLEHSDEVDMVLLLQKGLTELPEELFLLTNLRVLRLAQNAFQKLPEELFSMTSLEKLDLSYNQLTALPKGMEKLINLKSLGVSNNPIERFDLTLPKLTHLYLSDTDLTEVPNLQHLPLENLWLTSNKIKKVDVGRFPSSIKVLRLSENQIDSLSGPFEKLTVLDFLYLDENQLSTLPEAFSNLPKIRVLGMNQNAFNEVPKVLEKLSSLKQLYLRVNLLRVLPEWTNRLKDFSAENNPLDHLKC